MVDDYEPPILVNFFVEGHNFMALLDSGADVNALSYEAFQKLDFSLSESPTTLTSFGQIYTIVHGKTSLWLCHKTFEDESMFYIA